MERLAELIGKLKEQFDQKADSSKLLGTTLLIERELMKMESAQQPAATGSKISVVMPASRNGYESRREETLVEESPEIPAPQPIPQKEEPVRKPQPQYEERLKAREYEPKPQPKPQPLQKEPEQQPTQQDFDFNPLTEIPTLSQQHTAREINELLAIRDASLNDKLKENKVEVGHVVGEHPIKDLKKAIGVNDRYVFINELFRGDEVMYERSLKTINAFRIFAEAEYWIERELKVKLGWEEHKETTRHFYQLIKRRFS